MSWQTNPHAIAAIAAHNTVLEQQIATAHADRDKAEQRLVEVTREHDRLRVENDRLTTRLRADWESHREIIARRDAEIDRLRRNCEPPAPDTLALAAAYDHIAELAYDHIAELADRLCRELQDDPQGVPFRPGPWNAYWALRHHLDGKNPDGSVVPEVQP